jgi:hypothetical protein
MFHVQRELTVRSETNNALQHPPIPPPPPPDFRSLQNRRVIFLSTVAESKDIGAMYHVSLFFVLEML